MKEERSPQTEDTSSLTSLWEQFMKHMTVIFSEALLFPILKFLRVRKVRSHWESPGRTADRASRVPDCISVWWGLGCYCISWGATGHPPAGQRQGQATGRKWPQLEPGLRVPPSSPVRRGSPTRNRLPRLLLIFLYFIRIFWSKPRSVPSCAMLGVLTKLWEATFPSIYCFVFGLWGQGRNLQRLVTPRSWVEWLTPGEFVCPDLQRSRELGQGAEVHGVFLAPISS